MRDDVISLLEAFGVPVSGDDPLLLYVIGSVTERVLNETNLGEIPEGLHYLAVELAAGQYLNLMKSSGQLAMDGVDFEAAIKQIQEGDTSVTFAVGEGSTTPEARLDSMISFLTRNRTPEFLKYRKLLW